MRFPAWCYRVDDAVMGVVRRLPLHRRARYVPPPRPVMLSGQERVDAFAEAYAARSDEVKRAMLTDYALRGESAVHRLPSGVLCIPEGMEPEREEDMDQFIASLMDHMTTPSAGPPLIFRGKPEDLHRFVHPVVRPGRPGTGSRGPG